MKKEIFVIMVLGIIIFSVGCGTNENIAPEKNFNVGKILEAERLISESNEEIKLADKKISVLLSSNNPDTYWGFVETAFNRSNLDQLNKNISYLEDNYPMTEGYEKTIDAINLNLDNAENKLKEANDLELPDWYYYYIDQKIDSINNYRTSLNKFHELISNEEKLGKFLFNYLEGERIYVNYFFIVTGNTYKTYKVKMQSMLDKWKTAYEYVPLYSFKYNYIDATECILNSNEDDTSSCHKCSPAWVLLYKPNYNAYMGILSNSMEADSVKKWFGDNIGLIHTEIETTIIEAQEMGNSAELYWSENKKTQN